jgi:hypothetical protein
MLKQLHRCSSGFKKIEDPVWTKIVGVARQILKNLGFFKLLLDIFRPLLLEIGFLENS